MRKFSEARSKDYSECIGCANWRLWNASLLGKSAAKSIECMLLQISSFTYPCTGSEERGVLEIEIIPDAILPSYRNMKTIALYLHRYEYSWVVKIKNTPEAVLMPQYSSWP